MGARAGACRLRLALIAFLLAGAVLAPIDLQGQYFGRNKVKYRDFDFQVLETPHFKVYYYDREREAATEAARMAERWYARLSVLFDRQLTGKQPLILYASHPEFSQTTALAGEIGQATGGVTEGLKRRIILPMAGSRAETDHVIGHELVHAFQYDLAGISPNRPLTGSPTIAGMPLWVIEGMAEYYSIGPRSPLTAMWMRDAVGGREKLPDLDDLGDDYKYFPYRWGHSLWAYVGGRWGERAVWNVLEVALKRGGGTFAIDSVLGLSADTLAALWHRALRTTFEPLKQGRDSAAGIATPVVTDERGGSDLNLAPALSPDGRQMLFLSSRDPYSIDLYLADAESGRVVRRLTKSALDPHYENLQFVSSAGAWAADNERIALATVGDGRPELVILRASSGDRIKVHALSRFGEIFNPTWSPDGRRIAFVANEGGYLDLWTIVVETGELHQLTDDPEAELHPAWSPDGRVIAITTDRFGAGYALAAVNPETGAVTEIPTYRGARNSNPRWGPEGSLYFVSDVGGIPNIHRLSSALSGPAPVTRLYTGVSGITELSPAFDVAPQSGRLVFTAFEAGNYNVYRLDQPRVLAGGVAGTGQDAAELPPTTSRRDTRLAAFMGEPLSGLPDSGTFANRDYDADFSLDYVSPPTLGFAFGGYGSFVAGGISLYFSDMLGVHELGTQLQFQIVGGKVLNGIGAAATYVNRKSRAHWGITGGQIPYLSQAFAQALVDADGNGDAELLQQELRFWTVSRHAIGLFQYPFSRNQRLELSGGFERIDFDAELEERLFDLPTGQQLDRRTVETPACGDSLSIRFDLCVPASLNLVQGSAALVYDNSLPGYTGPIEGMRYRLEVSPYFGSLNYFGALGDWRGYLRVASPVTLAGRLLHYGRYGSDAEDQRLSRLFLGYTSLIRGYGSDSFDLINCPPNQPIEDCSEVLVFDQMFGSRVAVANAELRVSLFGPVGVLSRRLPLPMDLVGFFDAGVAWTNDDPLTTGDERASFLGGDRDLLKSAGVGLRFNLLGFALAELHYVKPLDRPLQSGFIHFSLNTGF